MVDVNPRFIGASIVGVTLNVSGTAITGNLTGDWVTGVSGCSIDAIAVNYVQATGTATSVTIAIDVLLENDANIYPLYGVAAAGVPSLWTLVIPDADTKGYFPIGTLAAAGAPIEVALGGAWAIRARAAIGAGDGAGTDNLRISFVGHREV